MDNWGLICLNLLVGGFILTEIILHYELLKFRESLNSLALKIGEFSSQSNKNAAWIHSERKKRIINQKQEGAINE